MKVNKKQLYDLYVVEGKSSYKIAKELNLSSRYIRYKLKEFGINRDQKEASAVRYQEKPELYSPIHTSISWQIPTKRRETYTWCRHYVNNVPELHNSIAKLCNPDNFSLKTKQKISSHVEDLVLKLHHLLPSIAYHYFVFGDCFIWTLRNSEEKITSIRILNPNLIDIKINPINLSEFYATMTPDIGEDILNDENFKIPEFIKKCVKNKTPIPLNSKDVFRVSRVKEEYMVYGKSIISHYFNYLIMLDRLKEESMFSDEAIEGYENISNIIHMDEETVQSELSEFKRTAHKTLYNIVFQEFPECKASFWFS